MLCYNLDMELNGLLIVSQYLDPVENRQNKRCSKSLPFRKEKIQYLIMRKALPLYHIPAFLSFLSLLICVSFLFRSLRISL